MQTGDRCPECQKGKVYQQREPACLVRVVGQVPLGATVYALEKLRCNLCGEVFTAETPAGVGPEKYDASAVSMVALLKYGSGVPFHRLEQLQGSLGIPLPAATQWEIVAEVATAIQPAYAELIRQAAQVAERQVESNSGLGKAIAYIRKNALFFQTERGAHASDLFMSLIHTCQRCGADPFHYLTALQTHAAALTATPLDWLPWNYRDTLERCATAPALPTD